MINFQTILQRHIKKIYESIAKNITAELATATQEFSVEIEDSALEEIGRYALEEIRINAASGIGSDGSQYFNKDGSPTAWRDTGELLDTARSTMQISSSSFDSNDAQSIDPKFLRQVGIEFIAEYASFVDEKKPFAGLPYSSIATLAARAESVLSRPNVIYLKFA